MTLGLLAALDRKDPVDSRDRLEVEATQETRVRLDSEEMMDLLVKEDPWVHRVSAVRLDSQDLRDQEVRLACQASREHLVHPVCIHTFIFRMYCY